MPEIEYNPRPNQPYNGLLETSQLKQKGDYFIVDCKNEEHTRQRQKNFNYAHNQKRKRQKNPIDFEISVHIVSENRLKVMRK